MAQKLTAKQEAFIRAYLKCGNASEAYRQAYDASKMKPEVVNNEASLLLAHPEISVRVAVYQAKANERAGVTLADHLTRMAQLSEEAREVAQFSAAIRAEELRAKASGLYVERVEHSGDSPIRFTFTLDNANADDREGV